MSASPVPWRIEVVASNGVSLDGQTLPAFWQAGRHAESERLAHFEVSDGPLMHNVLERLCWALLAWPKIDVLSLVDARAGAVVGEVRRASSAAARPYVWRDVWIAEGGGQQASLSAEVQGEDFPPVGQGALRGVLDPGEDSVAAKERVKLLIQRYAGGRVARWAHRAYQWVGERWRQRAQAGFCPAATVAPALEEQYTVPAAADGVLMMVPRLAPGGAEKNIIELAGRLVARGRRVHMMTTVGSSNSWADRVREAGIELLHLPEFLPTNCWLTFLHAFVRARGIGVLHIMNSHWAYQRLPSIRQHCPTLRVITQLHAEGEAGIRDYPTLAAEQDAFVDCHTVISEHLAQHMVGQFGVDRDRIRLIRSGLDLAAAAAEMAEHGADWRARNQVPAARPLVLFVGRFSELKRPMLFLDVAELVLQQSPQALFVMKGEGPLLGPIERRLDAHPALAAAVRIEDARRPVAEVMACADLLVLPSRMEGIAYVSYEAMLHGLPQVFADVGGQAELVTADTGVAVAPGRHEAAAYADAVLGLLAQPERRLAMGDAARARLRDWPSAEHMADSYNALYDSLLEKVVRAHHRGESRLAH